MTEQLRLDCMEQQNDNPRNLPKDRLASYQRGVKQVEERLKARRIEQWKK